MKFGSVSRPIPTLAGLLLAVGLLGWAPDSVAGNGNGNGTTQACTPLPTAASLPTFPAITAAQTAYGPVGSAVTTSITFDCTKNAIFAAQVTQIAIYAVPAPDAQDDPTYGLVIPTSLPNVWIQLQALPPAFPLTTGSNPLITVNRATQQDPGAQVVTVNFRAQLVLRGPVGSGGGFSGPIPLLSSFYNADAVSGQGKSTDYGRLDLGGGSTVVRSVACMTTGPAVLLPTVSRSTLGSAGATAGRTPFEVTVSGCPAGLAVEISLSGTPSSGGTPSTGIVQSTGSEANVAIQVLDADTLAPVDISGTQPKSLGVAQSGVPLVSRYYAQYYATAPAAGGTVTAGITYTLTYP
jgi:major type 1 subunit fimbrin (pilin)